MAVTTPSVDLRSINIYSGRVFNEQDGADLMALLDNRERKTRSVQGVSFLQVPPTLSPGPTPNTMEVRIVGGEGVSLYRPFKNLSTVDLSLEEANSGTLTGPTVVTTGPGYSRYIVVTAEWIGNGYDQKKDENKNNVFRLIDDGIMWRVFMGAEGLAPVMPAADLANQFALTGAIPVAVAKRDFGQTEVQADTLFNHAEHLEHIVNTIGSINGLARLIAGESAASSIRLIPTVPTYDEVELRKIEATGIAAVNGGQIQITPNVGTYIFQIEGKLRWLAPSAAILTDDLDVSSTYFLRAQIDEFGNLKIYTTKGALPSASGQVFDVYPSDLRGTPDAISGGGFPSTKNDLLLGIITTGLAGTVPSWTPLYSGDFTYSVNFGYTDTPLQVTVAIPKPFSCEYEISVRFDEDNWNPALPTANHRAFHPLGTQIHYYEFREVLIEARGRWLEDNGSGALRVATTTEYARPGFVLTIKPKHQDIS